ncbi:hypothetical protein L484_003752 [Morus notabilis]|uniref:Uncharacterized protein n=1 Tax=Morus notabilis TaxID=981085 RepID=W9ST65_9ROSA|nr:hypothetical protein L484_003752 [Morus notabilis]
MKDGLREQRTSWRNMDEVYQFTVVVPFFQVTFKRVIQKNPLSNAETLGRGPVRSSNFFGLGGQAPLSAHSARVAELGLGQPQKLRLNKARHPLEPPSLKPAPKPAVRPPKRPTKSPLTALFFFIFMLCRTRPTARKPEKPSRPARIIASKSYSYMTSTNKSREVTFLECSILK